MNSKFLYAATVAISLISTLALADEAPAAGLTRAQVNAELAQAKADGTLQRTDYDADAQDLAARSSKSRDQVKVEMADARIARKALIGPNANRTYNQYGTGVLNTSSIVTRAQVKEEVREAAANGTLQRTDYEDEALQARQARAHAASAKLAQRIKARLAGGTQS